GQEAGAEALHRERGEGCHARGPDRRRPRGVQGERGPAQHHQPRRLGEDRREEGRAHRLREAAHGRGEGQEPARRADDHRTVPVITRGAERHPEPAPHPLSVSAAPGRSGGTRGYGMAIPKVMGIETEYGITVRNQPDFNPILSSLLLINSYETYRTARIRWDYEAESPLRDARGFEYAEEKELPSKEESRLINLILPNGARFYVDHAHPEYSTPECTNPRDLVIWDKAGERILSISRMRAEASSPPEQRILIYKNNSDSKGNSYGTHENSLMDRRCPFTRLVQHLLPFLVTPH